MPGDEREADPLELVILDCDGVLFDSFRSNVAFYNRMLEVMGEPPLDEASERLCHVYATPQLFEHLFHRTPHKFEAAMRVAAEIDYLPFLEYMDPAPGLHDVLRELRERYRLALATNRGKSAEPLLRRFGLHETFEVVSTILAVEHPKPAPDLLLHCLRQTGVAAERSVYVGDMENDRIAADAAGIPFILAGADTDHTPRIDALAELPGLLARLRTPAGRRR